MNNAYVTPLPNFYSSLRRDRGVMATPVDQMTMQGYDLQFGVNVLGHVHLTLLLLPALFATPHPRVINVSSISHTLTPPKGINFDNIRKQKKKSKFPGMDLIDRYNYYSQSKLVSLFKSVINRLN